MRALFLLSLFHFSAFAFPPIINGEDASLTDYPWQVSFQYSEIKGFHFCGGAILNKHFVITAAHCVDDLTHPFELAGGGDGSRAKLSLLPKIKKIYLYPNYNSDTHEKTGGDVALVELEKDISYSASMQPIALPPLKPITDLFAEKSVYLHEKDLVITGWGFDQSLQTTQHLKMASGLKLYSPSAMVDPLYFVFNVQNHQTSCSGDSGGPLVRMDQKLLIGLSSHGAPDCLTRTEFYYTNLYRYLDWIYSVLH